MHDAKYIVFKRNEFYELMGELALPRGDVDCAPVATHIIERAEAVAVPDATVIRGQDLFAASALHAYANSIAVALAIINGSPSAPPELRVRLSHTADYFHERAVEAEATEYRKLPD